MRKEKKFDENGRVIRENRSQLKREREQTKKFATKLLKLPSHQYALLPIDNQLEAALIEGKRLSGNALKRHINFLTRLILEQDKKMIVHAHQHINHPYLNDSTKMKRIETEIQRLLNNDADIINELLSKYVDFDLQHVRQLTREAQKYSNAQSALPEEQQDKKPGKHQRKLRQYLQTLALYYDPDDLANKDHNLS